VIDSKTLGKSRPYQLLLHISQQGFLSSGECPTRSLSEPTVSRLMNISKLSHCATTGNLLSREGMMPIQKRKVRFQSQVRVVLIPCRTEYSAADLAQFLWWEEADFAFFKNSAINELKELMRFRNERLTTKEAIKILYQPGFNNDEIFVEKDIDSPVPVTPVGGHDLGLIDAHTDVDLTSLRRHNKVEDELLITVHPLALMCPQ
jgi:hypothetical protein